MRGDAAPPDGMRSEGTAARSPSWQAYVSHHITVTACVAGTPCHTAHSDKVELSQHWMSLATRLSGGPHACSLTRAARMGGGATHGARRTELKRHYFWRMDQVVETRHAYDGRANAQSTKGHA
eukprot:scaffold1318_cov388-Prasinococcus_capsulatus_cf.AAC.89